MRYQCATIQRSEHNLPVPLSVYQRERQLHVRHYGNQGLLLCSLTPPNVERVLSQMNLLHPFTSYFAKLYVFQYLPSMYACVTQLVFPLQVFRLTFCMHFLFFPVRCSFRAASCTFLLKNTANVSFRLMLCVIFIFVTLNGDIPMVPV